MLRKVNRDLKCIYCCYHARSVYWSEMRGEELQNAAVAGNGSVAASGMSYGCAGYGRIALSAERRGRVTRQFCDDAYCF